MQKIRVGVVRGGPSSEYDVSLRTGESVIRGLSTDLYTPLDILLTKEGEWFVNGTPTDLGTIATKVDIIWNALHGEFGEDGKLQKQLEDFGIPYTGSNSLSSAIGMHKGLAKKRFSEMGMLTPKGVVIEPDEVAFYQDGNIGLALPFPLIVKPITGGSSVATCIVHDGAELYQALLAASVYGDVLVEEVILGTEATVCVLDGNLTGTQYALFPIEIVPPPSNVFFNYDAKYSGVSLEICPGRFTLDTHSKLRDLAITAHNAIGARHYSRTDFIISSDGIYALEINTLPGLTAESLVPKALRATGMAFPQFLEHVIGLAMRTH